MLGNIPEDENFDFPEVDHYMGVAGVSFHNIEDKIKYIDVDTEIKLFRDYKNTSSKTAIGVMVEIKNKWEQIGFLPKKVSDIIACEMDANIPWTGKVIKVASGWEYPKYGVTIMIWVESED